MASRGIDGDALLDAELSLRGISALADLSTGEIVELVCRYAVWLPVETYLRSPWLAPYAVRRIRSRLDPRAPGPKRDLWGFPDERGYFSDDNSLIKGVVNNLRVKCDQSPYGDRPIGKGMVCCHVWAGTTGNPLLFSFVPNLVWLPKSLAGYSDAHADRPPHEVHEVLKAMSRRRFADQRPIAGAKRTPRAWEMMTARDIHSPFAMHEFDAGDRVSGLATRRIERMIAFLEATLSTEAPAPLRMSKRYHASFGPKIDRTVGPVQSVVSESHRIELLNEMRACLVVNEIDRPPC